MEDIDVICFAFIYGGYRCILFCFVYDLCLGYRCILFCLHLWRILMYFVLFTFMEDIDVFCFVYIYGGYRCNLFCLHLWRISM